MYFTLAVSAATRQGCAALAGAAERTDPRVMPLPGPARVAWRAPGGCATVLHVVMSDGMLSAFENVGWPDPQVACGPVQAGGHGGELLRGGYAQAAWRNLAGPLGAAAAAELFRRMTTRRLSLLRPPQADRLGAWALGTLAALLSGDWLNAREPVSRARI